MSDTSHRPIPITTVGELMRALTALLRRGDLHLHNKILIEAKNGDLHSPHLVAFDHINDESPSFVIVEYRTRAQLPKGVTTVAELEQRSPQ